MVIVASYGVQYLVAQEIIFGRIRKWIANPLTHDKWDVIVRFLIVGFTVAIAAVVPTIGKKLLASGRSCLSI